MLIPGPMLSTDFGNLNQELDLKSAYRQIGNCLEVWGFCYGGLRVRTCTGLGARTPSSAI